MSHKCCLALTIRQIVTITKRTLGHPLTYVCVRMKKQVGQNAHSENLGVFGWWIFRIIFFSYKICLKYLLQKIKLDKQNTIDPKVFTYRNLNFIILYFAWLEDLLHLCQLSFFKSINVFLTVEVNIKNITINMRLSGLLFSCSFTPYLRQYFYLFIYFKTVFFK